MLQPLLSPQPLSFLTLNYYLERREQVLFTHAPDLIFMTTCDIGRANILVLSDKWEMCVPPKLPPRSPVRTSAPRWSWLPVPGDLIWERLMVEPAARSLRKLLCTPARLQVTPAQK